MTNLKLLAELDFASLLTEAYKDIQTTSGQSLLGKYQQYLMTNECSYAVVNGFLNEAKNCQFDNAVASLSKSVCEYINENKYSWQLASTCEKIHNSNSRFNYLNENACKQVEDLLEGKSEQDVVSYIKAGALKNVMFVEAFRSITKSIFNSTPLVETNVEYQSITPISYFEQNNGKTFFEVLGKIYSVGENGILEENANAVSNEFLQISRLLESNDIKYVNDTFSIQIGSTILEAKEEGKCTKKNCKDGKCPKCGNDMEHCTCEGQEMNVAQLREHNEMFVSALGRTNRMSQHNQFLLEAFAKLVENFNNISILDNARIINTAKDSFVVIEHNGEMYSKSLKNTWENKADVVEAIKFIKSRTNVDLTEQYQTSIEKVVESKTADEKQKVLESIHNDEMRARRERIEKLTEQYKNDPVKLAMLAKVAEDLNKLA